MNKLYANFPSNREKMPIRPKNPTLTFIGGLVIGTIIGSFAMYIIMANFIINTFNL